MKRRDFLQSGLAAGAAALAAGACAPSRAAALSQPVLAAGAAGEGALKQSVCKWPYLTEFIPKRDPLASLAEAVRICAV